MIRRGKEGGRKGMKNGWGELYDRAREKWKELLLVDLDNHRDLISSVRGREGEGKSRTALSARKTTTARN